MNETNQSPIDAALERSDASSRTMGVIAAIVGVGLVGFAAWLAHYAWRHAHGRMWRTEEIVPLVIALAIGGYAIRSAVQVARGRVEWDPDRRRALLSGDPRIVWIYGHRRGDYRNVRVSFEDGRILTLPVRDDDEMRVLLGALAPIHVRAALGFGFSREQESAFKMRYLRRA